MEKKTLIPAVTIAIILGFSCFTVTKFDKVKHHKQTKEKQTQSLVENRIREKEQSFMSESSTLLSEQFIPTKIEPVPAISIDTSGPTPSKTQEQSQETSEQWQESDKKEPLIESNEIESSIESYQESYIEQEPQQEIDIPQEPSQNSGTLQKISGFFSFCPMYIPMLYE